MRIKWTYSARPVILFTGDLDLMSAISLDPNEPGVRLLKEGAGLCPVTHDHYRGVRKSALWLRQMQYEGVI